jgi:hypothetical protein
MGAVALRELCFSYGRALEAARRQPTLKLRRATLADRKLACRAEARGNQPAFALRAPAW